MTTSGARCSAVLFDVDGVLADTEGAVRGLWDEVCARNGRPTPDASSLEHIVGCSAEHTAHHLFPSADPAGIQRVLSLVREFEQDLRVTPAAGASELIRELHGNGLPVALVTGASPVRLARIVRALDVAAEVAATVTWGETQGKPHPGPYLLAARRLGVSPTDCLVVEDAPAGVVSAVAAGATCIGLASPGSKRARALREAGSRVVVASIRDITVRDAAPDQPSDTRSYAALLPAGRGFIVATEPSSAGGPELTRGIS